MHVANPKILAQKAFSSESIGIWFYEAARHVCFRTKRPRSSWRWGRRSRWRTRWHWGISSRTAASRGTRGRTRSTRSRRPSRARCAPKCRPTATRDRTRSTEWCCRTSWPPWRPMCALPLCLPRTCDLYREARVRETSTEIWSFLIIFSFLLTNTHTYTRAHQDISYTQHYLTWNFKQYKLAKK